MATDEVYLPLWHLANDKVPFDRALGICGAWLFSYRDWGSPLTTEFTAKDGKVYQVFTHAIVCWDNGAHVI